MKNPFKYLLILALSLGFLNCSDVEDLQDDPNRATQVSPELLLTNIEVSAFNNVSLSAALASRYLAYTNGVNQSQYYNWQRSGFGNYDNLKQVDKMVEEAIRTESEVYQILATFFNSYFIVSLTEVFGDVPYTEAAKADEGLYMPIYDSQKSIYLNVLNDLQNASLQLAQNEEGILGDIIYNGDKLKWRKLINSYYLRILMDLSRKSADPDLNIIPRFNEVVNDPDQYPIFTSNEDSGILNYVNTQDNRYPYFNDNDLQTAYYMEESFVSKLQSLQDPRLFVFAEKKPNAADAADGDFTAYGGLYGSDDLNSNTAKAVAGEASRINPRYFNDPVNEPSILMSYAELEFILAEAAVRGWTTQSAEEHYKNGIGASMEFYGITDVSTYLDNPDIQLPGDNQIEQILTQKHIAMFMNTGWQVFFEQRRTGFPEFNTDGSGILNGGQIPLRWMYPNSEATNNPENLTTAIDRQFPSGDNINGVMWLLQ